MEVELAYGTQWLTVDLPTGQTTIIEPIHYPSLADEVGAIREALRRPYAGPPLAELVRPVAKGTPQVVVVFSDLTRPVPNHLLIPTILDELDLPHQQVTLLNATGLHRANTPEELERMLGADVVCRYRVVNHDAEDEAAQVLVGTTRGGAPIWLDRHYVEATVRIVTGFIEPHFFAGFSGGSKSVLPGVAGSASIMANHNAARIGDPNATWAVTAGNPIFEESREAARRVPPHFLVNVTLNRDKRITGVFAGRWEDAHDAGCAFVKESAMRSVDSLFDVVVTTNSGYPLDLNLYQAVKGMSAAAQVVRPGGAIVMAAECREGVGHGCFAQLLHRGGSPEEILDLIHEPDFAMVDQWQVQIQAEILRKARVYLHSGHLTDDDICAAHLRPCRDIGSTVRELLAEAGPGARVGVLPLGPLTVPYLRTPVTV